MCNISNGLAHCYWPRTKAKQKFIDFGWKIEVDTKTAGLLFRLIGLNCWWLIADSNFIYHKETRYDTPKTKNGSKKFTQLQFWVHWFHQFEVGTHISCLILKRNNHSTLLTFFFHLKILLSLNGVFWNTLTPLKTLICHISIFAIFTQFQIRLWRFLSLKRITMNDIVGYLPILVFNFNLYGIVCTDRSSRCKGLLFVKGIC